MAGWSSKCRCLPCGRAGQDHMSIDAAACGRQRSWPEAAAHTLVNCISHVSRSGLRSADHNCKCGPGGPRHVFNSERPRTEVGYHTMPTAGSSPCRVSSFIEPSQVSTYRRLPAEVLLNHRQQRSAECNQITGDAFQPAFANDLEP